MRTHDEFIGTAIEDGEIIAGQTEGRGPPIAPFRGRLLRLYEIFLIFGSHDGHQGAGQHAAAANPARIRFPAPVPIGQSFQRVLGAAVGSVQKRLIMLMRSLVTVRAFQIGRIFRGAFFAVAIVDLHHAKFGNGIVAVIGGIAPFGAVGTKIVGREHVLR